MAQSIFRKESLDKVTSPEQLNDYIKISSAGVWLVLTAVIILLVCLGVWGIFGHLTSSVQTCGVAQNGSVVCYAADASKIEIGQTVSFSDGSEGTVTAVAQAPVARTDIENQYDSFTAYSLALPDWSYPITVSADDCTDGYVAAEIVVEQLHPISFIWH